MSGVTDADREKAAAALNYGPTEQVSPMDQEYVEQIAVALAEEREKARAPFLALIDDLEEEGRESGEDPYRAGLDVAIDAIRRAAEDEQ